MKTLNSKFATQFKNSNKETFEARGTLIVKQMTNVSNQMILELENKKLEIELQIARMMDFGKSHTTQLKLEEPSSYKDHLEKVKQLKVQLAGIDFELDIVKETHSEWFEEPQIQ